MSNQTSNTSESINLCTAWIILARAMCVVDHESLPVEERTAVKFAKGAFAFSDKQITDSKKCSYLFSVENAVECVKSLPASVRKEVLYGLIAVAASDNKYKDKELMLLASLANVFAIDEDTFQKLCHRGNVMREFL